jgi:hypothetical protein
MVESCEIKIKSPLDPLWPDWFQSLKLTHLEGNVALLSGLLDRIRNLNLTLISVNFGRPSTQDCDKEKA